ncbi:MAG TPA: alpha/beta hydrolase [Thermomicrobiales bacterium]|nr:alpha/beta hydrolase [Thermomicrobiales bacterium]
MPETILDRTPPPADRRISWGDGRLQFADLRRPEGDGPHLAAIAIHGGFWRNRYSLDYMGHLCAALTAQGVVTWNIEYRRVGDPGGGWAGTFQDVVAASRYLFSHAEEFSVDRERIIVLGHSAGGHLVSWLASLGNVPSDSEIAADPLPLAAAIPIAGVLDLARCWELHLSDDAVVDFLGGTPGEVLERYAAASPIVLVPPSVPSLIIHGQYDENVPIELSERYHAALLAAGALSAMPLLPRVDHFDVVDPESRAWPTIARAIGSLFD